LQFINDEIAKFSVGGQFHLKITVGAKTTFLAACVATSVQPDPHSDQSSMIHYSFTGSSYSTEEPA